MTEAQNIVSVLEIERSPERLKVALDQILTEFDSQSLVIKFEKLIRPKQYISKISQIMDSSKVLDYLEEKSLLTEQLREQLTKHMQKDNGDICCDIVLLVLPTLTDDQFFKLQGFFKTHMPIVSIMMSYNGFYEDVSGSVVARPTHLKSSVRLEVRKSDPVSQV